MKDIFYIVRAYHNGNTYDQQIGRWNTQDPKLQYESPYLGMGNNPINGVDLDGKWFWESKNVRQARQYARQTGGEFDKWKGNDGKKWASVTTSLSNETGVSSQVFKPGADRSELLRSSGGGVYETELTTMSGFDYAKGVAKMGDAWAHGWGEFDRNGQAPDIVKAVAGLNPAIGFTNGVIAINTKVDMYGEDASSDFDQTMAWIGVFASAPGYGNAARIVLGKLPVSTKILSTAVKVGEGLDLAETIVGFIDDAGCLDSLKPAPPSDKKK